MGWNDCPATAINGEFMFMPEKSAFETAVFFGKPGCQFVAASSANETARGSAGFDLSICFCSKIAIICSIGVMPQIGSFEKGKLYEIAPTSLPFIYTGEPDIPANTAVLSALPPLKRPTIRSCFGPTPPGNIPRISTLNSSGSLPRNTVRAVPRIPSLTSTSGRNCCERAETAPDICDLTATFCPLVAVNENSVRIKRAAIFTLIIVKKIFLL